MTPLFRKFLGINWVLVLTMMGLLVFGVFAIYSAVEFRDDPAMANKWNDQIRWIFIGLLFFFPIALVDYKWIRWGCIPMYLGGIGLLLAVNAFGHEVNGSKSWFKIGPMMVQPSQFAIAAGIVMLAFVLAEMHKYHPLFRNHLLRLIVAGVVGGVPFLLVLKEGDMGSASVWIPVIASMLLVGSIPFRYLISITLIGLTIIPIAYVFVLTPHQQGRIDTFKRAILGQKLDTHGDDYAFVHITNAIGSAGWKGKGFLAKNVPMQKSINRMGFIPKDTAHNDYIFAVIAEEHGFRGTMILISAMGLLMTQCIFVAFYSRDQFGRLIIVGVIALLFAHVFQHIGMQIGILPITGIPLPFISYGGTFTLTILSLMGMIQSVWVHRNAPLYESQRERAHADSSIGAHAW